MPSATSFASEIEEPPDSPITVSPISPSCFANVPPTIYFASSKEKDNTETQEEICDWAGTWGKHMKSSAFRLVQDYQKVNHFPGSFHFGRKDKLWQNVSRMAARYGRAFNFIPETYVLPQDAKNLKNAWERSGSKKNWIIKPPASARGTGIHVIHKWSQIPKKQPVVVQRYLSAPFLINDTKFDLRLYVLLTSFDPLRIYVYDDGLVRFASVKYSKAQHSLGDRFMHLTNYSINKRSASYTSNEDETICQGHKWSLKALWGYLEKQGIDTKTLWSSLVDIIIKTIISCECHVWRLVKYNTKSRYSCFELFGFDILLDKNLRPWLLEVNISPSLHSNSLLDTNIKGNLVKDMLNIAGYQVPNKIGSHSLQASLLKRFGISTSQTKSLCMNKVLHRWRKTPKEKQKHLRYEKQDLGSLSGILEELTPDDVRILMEGEDEYQRRGSFIRVFPTPTSHSYHQYFDCLHYYNRLLDAWEHRVSGDRLVGQFLPITSHTYLVDS
ncbi:TTLL4 [Cordylochernes scorpioides]|uniref:TTLL4 n=1 Tax=Cordylochernes scorpioides TaxID=51811 RepID=A0ABY6JYW0_9ARAC|nr:TTLL4 [Cordylochernes scorpioides]